MVEKKSPKPKGACYFINDFRVHQFLSFELELENSDRAVILNSTNRLNRCRLTREEQRFNFTPVPQCAGVHIPMSQHSIPPPSRQPKNRFEVQF